MSRDAIDALLFAAVIIAACFAAPVLFLIVALLILIGAGVLALAQLIGMFGGDDEELP